MPVDGIALRRWQVRTVQSCLTVHVRRDVLLAHERPVSAGRDRHIRPAGELEHADRIRGRLLERLVACDGRHREQFQLRRCQREEERDRVVVPGVAIEQDRYGGGAHARSIASTSSAVGSDGCAPKRL